MALELGLLFDVGMIVVIATLVSFVFRFLRQPMILGYITTGLLLGPIGLGSMNLSFAGFSLGINTIEEVLIFSELGIAFLLFGVGVETNFSKLLGLGKTILIGGVAQVVLTFLVVVLGTVYLNLFDFPQSVFLGVIFAFSSTAIVVKILSDRHEIGTIHGKLLIGFLLVQDLLVIIALPFLKNFEAVFSLSVFAPILVQGLLLLVLAFSLNRYVYPKLFRFGSNSDELLFLASVSSCFVFILLAFLMDFSIAIAAFIAGLALSNLPYNLEVFHKIRGLRDFFSIIFFVTLGMQINFSFAQFPITILLFLLAVVFVFKPVVFFLITLLSGYGSRIALTVALGLAQVSEFSFIIASQGRNILDHTPGLYSLIILIIALSMGVSPNLMNSSSKIFGFLKRKLEKNLAPFYKDHFSKKIVELAGEHSDLSDHLIVVGAGTIGFGIAKSLEKDFELVVVDHNLEVIYRCRKHGIRAIYGSADNFEALRNANILKAKILVLSLPDTYSSVLLSKFAKKENSSITIFGRAHYYSEALKLYNVGVDYVVMTHVIGANVFLQNISKFLETGKTLNLESLSDEYKKFINEKAIEENQRRGNLEYKNF